MAGVLTERKFFLYVAASHDPALQENDGVYAGSLDGKESKLLLKSSSNVAYASGYLLYLHQNTLIAQAFDPDKLEFRGNPVNLAQIAYASDQAKLGHFDMYTKSTAGVEPEKLLLDQSKSRRISDWSRDGKYILYDEENESVDVCVLHALGERSLTVCYIAAGSMRHWVDFRRMASGLPMFRMQSSFEQSDLHAIRQWRRLRSGHLGDARFHAASYQSDVGRRLPRSPTPSSKSAGCGEINTGNWRSSKNTMVFGDSRKRGGVRTIYYWAVAHEKILMLMIYSKTEQDDLTTDQLRILKQVVREEFKL